MRIMTLIAAIGLVTACEEVVDCTDIAVASVTVDVTDEAGNPLVPDSITYTQDGGDVTDCDDNGVDATFVCGWEQAGEIEITIEADGYATFVETITVESDECHVIGETLDAQLALE